MCMVFDKTIRPRFSAILALSGSISLAIFVSCGGGKGLSGSESSFGSRPTDRGGKRTPGNSGSARLDSLSLTLADDSTTSWHNLPSDGIYTRHLQSSPGSDESDFDPAIGDEYVADEAGIWRSFDLAEEYYLMGNAANSESSWEEAQYYFERALKMLANLDIETDSLLTPEAIKYNTLLDNVVADYRISLRSLGRLDEDATPSALLDRFGDLESGLNDDSMVVFKGEAAGVSYDLPVIMNDRVRNSIVYLQTVAKEAFARYLGRSKKYAPLFRQVLAESGLPQDLIYLSLIESGFNPHAYSWARASGLWQFIASTGKLYGLDRDWWVDERKDPVKSTRAAAVFLKELFEKFGNWELAMAAYNGGPGRVARTIRDQRTNDFWKMRLKRQTMDYVPLIYAAAIIGKEPEKYGFRDIQYEDELHWDEVVIDRCLELKVVAQHLNCSVDDLKELNPELLRSYTPPNSKNYVLHVPSGLKDKFWASYSEMPTPKESNFARYKVKRRETIASIASRFGVTQYAILEANNLRQGTKLKSGRELIIPVPGGRDLRTPSRQPRDATYSASGGEYVVRVGDSMWDIARAFGVTVEELRGLNNLDANARIYAGEKIKIPGRPEATKPSDRRDSKDESAAPIPVLSQAPSTEGNGSGKSAPNIAIHKVRSGDSIWEIAKRYRTTAERIRVLNGLGRTSRIHVGQQLIVQDGSKEREFVLYQVKDGDTLSDIARRYNTTIEKILANNNLNDPHQLKIGDRIKISVN